MKNIILSIGFILSAIAILSLSLISPSKAYGQYTQNEKEISIDKKIRSIDDSQYFDNIEASKKTFFENDVIEFQIKVENTGDETLNNINVKDNLPKYIGLIFNPGTFNSDENSINWTIDKLEPGESKEYLIRAKIKDSSKLTVLTKQTNRAETKVDNLNDSDNASYFIGKTTVPATGVSDIMVKTILIALTAVGGFSIRKFARGY